MAVRDPRVRRWRRGRTVFFSCLVGAFLLTGLVVSLGCSGAGVSGSSGSTRQARCPSLPEPPPRWPGACWRPFGPASPFNQRLPSRPRLAPGSAAMIARLFELSGGRGPATLDVYRDGRGGDPVYWSRPSDPAFVVHCTERWGRCPLEGRRIHIPAGARPERDGGDSPGGGDRHISVVEAASGRVYDLWQVDAGSLPASGGRLDVSWGGVTALDGPGIRGAGDATAARFSNIAGRVRAEELAAGRIEHALFIVVPCDGGDSVFPARAAGAPCPDGGAPPMGARLQLDYSGEEIEALPLPVWQKALLRAMSEYGMFIGDTGTSNLFSVEREAGLQYRSLGRPDRWVGLARRHRFNYWSGEGGVYIGDIAAGIDWHRLRVIAPCVSTGAC